jgi:hypothetical protein
MRPQHTNYNNQFLSSLSLSLSLSLSALLSLLFFFLPTVRNSVRVERAQEGMSCNSRLVRAQLRWDRWRRRCNWAEGGATAAPAAAGSHATTESATNNTPRAAAAASASSCSLLPLLCCCCCPNCTTLRGIYALAGLQYRYRYGRGEYKLRYEKIRGVNE